MAASSVDGECCDEEVILNDTIHDSTLEHLSRLGRLARRMVALCLGDGMSGL